MKTALLLLAEGFEEIEALTPVDYLRRAGIEVTTLGVLSAGATAAVPERRDLARAVPGGGGGPEIEGGHGIRVRADRALGPDEALCDAIIVPGGGGGVESLAASPAAIGLIKRHEAAGRLVAAICAAPAVVLHGACGMLGGKRFTGYPGTEKRVEGARFVAERVVVDGKLITARAAGCSGEFARAIIAALAGEDVAAEVAAKLLLG